MGNSKEELTGQLKLFCKFVSKDDCTWNEAGLSVSGLPVATKDLKAQGESELRFEVQLADNQKRKTVQAFVIKLE